MKIWSVKGRTEKGKEHSVIYKNASDIAMVKTAAVLLRNSNFC